MITLDSLLRLRCMEPWLTIRNNDRSEHVCSLSNSLRVAKGWVFVVGLFPFLIYLHSKYSMTQSGMCNTSGTAFALCSGQWWCYRLNPNHIPHWLLLSRELFWLLYSSIECTMLFHTKMQHLFWVIILKNICIKQRYGIWSSTGFPSINSSRWWKSICY